MQKKIIFITLLLSITLNAKDLELKSYIAKIDEVIDGDTIMADGVKIRFSCVDAYESKKNKHLKKQVDNSNLSEKEILKLGLKQKKLLEQYIDKNVVIYYNNNDKYDLYNRLLAVVKYEDIILNNGLKYYNNKSLCKYFNLN